MRGDDNRLLSRRGIVFIGTISYSLYRRYLDEVIGKAALLESEEIFERSPQPLLIFVGVQQDRHSIMERP
jgi:hypothetical protein